MNKFFYKFSLFFLKPSALSGIVFLFLSFLIFKCYLNNLLSFLFAFLITELYCRFQYFLFHKRKREKRFFITKKDIPFVHHPYLPWSIYKNWTPQKDKASLLDDKAFMLGGVPTNNLGLFYASEEKKFITQKKEKHTYRILILGDSVSLNFASPSNKVNYPLLLEKKLQAMIKNTRIEVINASFFAYTTQEIIIKFLFDLQYLDPDLILFYGGYSDIRGYLTESFETDFSHFRRSIKTNYSHLVFFASLISLVKSYFLDNVVSDLFSHSNLKLDLIKMINKKNHINLNQPFEKGLETFSRNISTLIHVCQGKNIPLIFSTYCHYLNNQRKNSEAYQIFNTIIEQQNAIIRDLCSSNKITYVDNAIQVDCSEENFLDDVHFTEKGMNIVAQNFSDIISKFIKNHPP
ncbi:MAG: SGNH/GDSL hydrolase family protein [Proteobacteria bacterium]|nr:SGNH/GDSL hydrolase family protein [Pseudomonadota bacterium]